MLSIVVALGFVGVASAQFIVEALVVSRSHVFDGGGCSAKFEDPVAGASGHVVRAVIAVVGPFAEVAFGQ